MHDLDDNSNCAEICHQFACQKWENHSLFFPMLSHNQKNRNGTTRILYLLNSFSFYFKFVTADTTVS
jgi:hypothetical protein